MSRTLGGRHGLRDRAGSVVALVAVVLAGVLVMAAVVIGPSETLRGDSPDDNPSGDTIGERAGNDGDEVAPSRDASAQPEFSVRNRWVDAISTVIGFALLGLLVWWGVTGVREQVRRRRTARRQPLPEESLDPLPRPGVVTEHAADHESALGSGTPRNAIVALWHRLETDVADGGLPRRPAETSAEFTARFLDELGADSSAAQRLAGLYREARFSTHELTETDRAAARQALDLLHRSLGSRTR